MSEYWSHPHIAALFYLLLALGLVGLLFLAFRLASAPSARSKALVALRASALGTLVLILLNPTRVQEARQTGPQPGAVFLIDESRSMSLESPRTRSQAAQDVIQQAISQLPANRKPPIRRFGFGREITALSDSESGRKPSGRSNEAQLCARAACRPVRRGASVRRLRFFRRPLDRARARAARCHRPGFSRAGRAGARRRLRRRANLGRRRDLRDRPAPRRPPGHSRSGASQRAQPRLWRPAGRAADPIGFRAASGRNRDAAADADRWRAERRACRRDRSSQRPFDGRRLVIPA